MTSCHVSLSLISRGKHVQVSYLVTTSDPTLTFYKHSTVISNQLEICEVVYCLEQPISFTANSHLEFYNRLGVCLVSEGCMSCSDVAVDYAVAGAETIILATDCIIGRGIDLIWTQYNLH